MSVTSFRAAHMRYAEEDVTPLIQQIATRALQAVCGLKYWLFLGWVLVLTHNAHDHYVEGRRWNLQRVNYMGTVDRWEDWSNHCCLHVHLFTMRSFCMLMICKTKSRDALSTKRCKPFYSLPITPGADMKGLHLLTLQAALYISYIYRNL